MNKNTIKIVGLVMMLLTSLVVAMILEISEVARYICIMSGKDFTMRWYDFLNPVSAIFVIISYAISFVLIHIGFSKKDETVKKTCK